MLKKYKAVFFDVGGTLLRVHPSVGEVYSKMARGYGFSGSPEEVDRQFRLQWKKTGGIESLGRQSGMEIEKKFWRDLVFHVFEHFGRIRFHVVRNRMKNDEAHSGFSQEGTDLVARHAPPIVDSSPTRAALNLSLQ